MPRRATARKADPAATEIASTVQVGGVPAAPGNPIPGTPPQTDTLRAYPTAEYVAAGGFTALINYARSLPAAIDDLTAELGFDIYSQMMLDSQVSSAIDTLRASVLEDGMRFLPAVEDEDDPNHDRAVELADWCTAVMERLSPKLDPTLWDLCAAFAFGNRVAELVWHVAPDPHTKRPALLLKAIKTKPRENVGFVVDSYNNLLGLLAVEPGRAYPVQQTMYVSDLSKIPNLLPVEKFCVLSFRPENGDPRGTTPLRAAYDPWWLAKQGRALHLAFMSQVAAPSVVGITPENAEPATVDSAGNPIDPSLIVTPEQDMAKQLATLKSGTALAFPFGSAIHPLMMAGDGGMAFERFDDRMEKRITKAVLNQLLSTEESKHQTRAATGQHKDLLDTIVRLIRGIVESMMAEQVVRLLILWNFGEDALELAPVPSLGKTEQHDMASMAAGIAALESSGYLGESQKPGIDALLGLPVRDEEADAQAAAEALAMATAIAAANPTTAPAAKREGTQQAGDEVASANAAAGQKIKTARGRNKATGATPSPGEQPNPGATEQSGKEGS